MTKTLTLIASAAALTAALGLPAWSAMHTPAQGDAASALTTLLGTADQARPLILVDDDGEDDDGGSATRRESDDDEGECEDDDGNCGSAAAAAPAPAGSVPPPQNGLFDNSAAPKATVK